MYKKNLTKSFFDSDTTKQKTGAQFYKNNKENISPHTIDATSRPSEICQTTKSKLKDFILPAAINAQPPVSDACENQSLVLSQSKEESVIQKSSQNNDRVRWRISPPPPRPKQHGSAQKLTINEMFDIYQASQHSSQTPVKQLDPTGNLWSRYDSAEPLPYLDLDLSPAALQKTPRSDAKLRRTTSLPTWSVDCRDRKRRKVQGPDDGTDSGGKMRNILEKVQLALHQGDSPLTSFDAARATDKDEALHMTSDDFGSDDFDEELLMKLPEFATPARRSVSNPLPNAIDKDIVNRSPSLKPDRQVLDRAKVSEKSNIANDSGIDMSRSGSQSPGAQSDYSVGFDEGDFLAATQASPSHHKSDQMAAGVTGSTHPRVDPEDVMQDLDEDAFSEFEDYSPHEDRSIFTVVNVSFQEYSKDKKVFTRTVLSVQSEQGLTKMAKMEEDWAGACFEEGDMLRFHGPWTEQNLFVANNLTGLVICHPDVLVSCTSVADSHTCMRKSVLQDRVRATSQLSKPLLYGSILHALLQSALTEENFADTHLRQHIDREVDANMEKLFLIDETVEAAKDYLYSKIPLLQQWSEDFFGEGKAGRVEPMRGRDSLQAVTVGVNRALDIEERFWSPMYGLKGNVDVTAELDVNIGGQKRVVTAPLEFKTGKTAYQQSSYRAQVMLYTLMMSERYRIDVTAGFLYYLESKQIVRVAALHNEVRGLVLMRNELARHMKNKTIPPMIINKRLCGSCYAADACFIYHKGMESGTTLTSRLDTLFEGKTGHLGPQDVAFFEKWESLITKEEGEMFRYRKELWHMSSKAREEVNRCFSGLVIVGGTEIFDDSSGKMNQWSYQLCRTEPGKDFAQSQIAEREPIIVSDEEGRFAISCGFVTRVMHDRIVIQVDRPLRDSRVKEVDFDELSHQRFTGLKKAAGKSNANRYRIDRDEFKNGMGMVRNNLISLLLDPGSNHASPNTSRQRELIIDRVPPKFEDIKISANTNTQSENALNVDQLKAKNKILSARDYALILGMPGTGKTTTIARIIRSLVATGQSVLLTSYTHSAVDTILLKLGPSNVSILRLGGYSKIHPDVAKFAKTERHNCKTFEELDHYYNSPNVVATTCLSINHAIFQKRRFDYCIFDEASQATLPVCLGPLRFADKFVLVGDHYQLPPLVKDFEARKQGLDVSLFKMLCEAHPSAVVELQHQYRMNADIMSVSNTLIYNGRLTCGTKELEKRRLNGIDMSQLASLHPHIGSCGTTCWLQHVIDPDRSVIYLNTDDIAEAREIRSQDHITNQAESTIVSHIVEGLVRCGLHESDIGVISPYRSQLKILHQDLRAHPEVVVDTADKYQGRDKECIIVSLVRSNDARIIGELLKDWRRINVALTRAKAKMIVIGSQDTLAHDKLLNAFLHMMHRNQWAFDLPFSALHCHQVPSPSEANSSPLKAPREVKISTASRKVILQNRPILRDVMNSM